MHANTGREMLTQQSDGGLSDHERVGCIDSLLRIGRSMSCLPTVTDVGVRYREGPRLGNVQRCRMCHHREAQALKGTALKHLDLAATGFFNRRAVDLDGQAEFIGQRGQRQRSTDRTRRNEVMPAGMSETRKGVVFRAETNATRA